MIAQGGKVFAHWAACIGGIVAFAGSATGDPPANLFLQLHAGALRCVGPHAPSASECAWTLAPCTHRIDAYKIRAVTTLCCCNAPHIRAVSCCPALATLLANSFPTLIIPFDFWVSLGPPRPVQPTFHPSLPSIQILGSPSVPQLPPCNPSRPQTCQSA